MEGRSSMREPITETSAEDDQSSRIRDVVSVRWLLVGVLVLAVPAVLASAVIPVVGGPVGVAIGAFLIGALGVSRGYVLAGVIGAFLGISAAAIDPRLLYLAESTRVIQLAAVGGAGGLILSLLGVYFGRDLRAGVTQDIE